MSERTLYLIVKFYDEELSAYNVVASRWSREDAEAFLREDEEKYQAKSEELRIRAELGEKFCITKLEWLKKNPAPQLDSSLLRPQPAWKGFVRNESLVLTQEMRDEQHEVKVHNKAVKKDWREKYEPWCEASSAEDARILREMGQDRDDLFDLDKHPHIFPNDYRIVEILVPYPAQ